MSDPYFEPALNDGVLGEPMAEDRVQDYGLDARLDVAAGSIEIHPSSLPLQSLCSAAGIEPDVNIVGDLDAADLGTATHSVLGRAISGDYLPEPGCIADGLVTESAARWQVDPDELGMLSRMGWRLWTECLREKFPDPQTEVQLRDATPGRFALVGRVDLMDLVDTEVRVCDWKTGWSDGGLSPLPQLMAYGLMALRLTPEAETVWGCVARIRDLELDRYRWTRGELEAWWAGLQGRLGREAYNAGSHCAYCKRLMECPAGIAHLGFAVAITDAQLADMRPTDGAWLGAALSAFRLAQKKLASAEAIIKAMVIQQGGRVPMGDGRELRITEQEQRPIDPRAAWPLLVQEIGTDRLMECLSVAKGKVEDVVKAAAAPRGKGKAVVALMARLDAAGGLGRKIVEKLEIRRVLEELPQTTHRLQ